MRRKKIKVLDSNQWFTCARIVELTARGLQAVVLGEKLLTAHPYNYQGKY
jgi:hypothetical protein